jgi:hypothetical protein
MGARLVLLAFILLYVLVGVALSPVHGRIAPVDEYVWDGLTLATFAVMIALEYPAAPLSRALGMTDQTVIVALLLAICLLLAVLAIVRLMRKDGRGKGGAMFLLMFAVSVPAGVALTLYEFTRFGH